MDFTSFYGKPSLKRFNTPEDGTWPSCQMPPEESNFLSEDDNVDGLNDDDVPWRLRVDLILL